MPVAGGKVQYRPDADDPRPGKHAGMYAGSGLLSVSVTAWIKVAECRLRDELLLQQDE
jgi:hypothetical protein